MSDSKRNTSLIIFAATAFCCFASVSCFAQWSGALGSSWNNPTSASISRILVDRMNQRMLAKRLAQKRGGTSSETTSKASANENRQVTAYAARSLTFNATPARLKLDAIVADLGGSTEQRVQTRQLLNQVLDTYDKESAALGYKNDLPLSFASFIMMSAAAYRGTDVPGDEKLIELRSVIADSAIESGVFKSMTDMQKQEMSEILVVFGTLAFSGYSQSKQTGDLASMNSFRQLGGQNLKTVLGLDPEAVKVDANGISFASASPGSAPDSARATPAEVPTMHAGDLVKAYETNEIRADQMFGGKRVRIVGSVNSIESLADGRAALVFRSTVSTYGMAKCFFSKAQRSKLASVSTNQQAMVEGIVKEFGGGWDGAKAYVVLENCTIP
jgi:hypothetical protein